MRVERLRPRDATEYRALMLEAYELNPSAFTSTVEERAALPMSWWEARLSDAPEAREVVVGLRDDDVLWGVAGMAFNTRQKIRHKATLFGIYVKKSQRGSGAAARLIVAALDEARKRAGLQVVQLTVTEDNPAAEELYKKMGFVAFGTEPFAVAVDGGYISKIHMWRRL